MPALNGLNGLNGHKKSITGGGLLDRVTANEEIRETQIAFFMRQLLQALEFMHSKNVVHLDLKPENIMLSEAGTDQIKLTDFGLSRRLRRDKQTFGTVGAPEFVAPEIVRQKPVTLATDMWSVGVLAYVMLTGISPFHGDSDEETLQNVVQVKYAFDPKHFKNVSPEAKDFISKLLHGDQKKRLSVQQALSHPWMQLGDTKDHGELLTTQFLKEFKYRHKWVERRVFVQYGPDDEASDFDKEVKGIRSALELLEPTYFPPLVPDARRAVTVVEPQPVAATFKLPSSSTRSGRDSGAPVLSDRQGRRPGSDSADIADASRSARRDPLQNGSTEKDHSYQNGHGAHPEGERAKKDSGQDIQSQKGQKPDLSQKRSKGETLADQQQLLSPQELSALLSAERRAIEEELANRILSDISEEGSVASEAGSNPPSRKFSMENLLGDHEKTPTQDDYSILMKPNRPLRLEIDDIVSGDTQSSPRRKGKGGSKGLKSPVRQSPTKEQVMECIVSSAKAVLSPNKNSRPEFDLSPKIKAAKREAEMARKKDDDDFDALMQDVDRMKKDFRRRLSEIRDGYDNKPKADLDNGYDRTRGPAPPIVVPQYPYPGYEVEDYEWDTDYQMGPETFLLQQRNAGLAGRIRDYRRQLLGDSASQVENGYLGMINRDVSVRERRRYTDLIRDDKDLAKAVDVLDKDIKHIQTGAVKRVRMTPVMAAPVPGPGGVCSPVFQHRLKDTVFAEDSQITFQCVVVGSPEPTVCWFHNEALVVEGPRHKMTLDHHKATLTIQTAQLVDVGVYKCVAENEHGQSTCVARLKQGDLPTRPSRPDVILASDTEVFITWEQPPLTSGLGILCYKLEFRKCGEDEWSCPWFVIADTLDEESVVVKRLEFLGIYQFRVVAKNAFGWGEPSLASRIIQTHVKGAPKLNIELLRKDYHLNVVNLPHHVSLLSEIPEEEGVVSESAALSTSSEPREESKKPSLDLNTSENPKNRYQLDSELFRGRFCLIRNAMDKKNDTNAHCVAKICMASPDHKEQAMNEYEILREIQHENVVHMMSAYFKEDFLVLFMEKLHDDLLDRFTYQDYYTEDHVARVIAQIFSALQWIHFKRICLLDLQPDNIMFPSKRIWSVKIVDTGSAVRMIEGEQTKAPSLPVEYSAPEVLQTGTASPMTDIWGVGLLGFLLLSGVNPYVLDTDSSEADIIKAITMEKCDINYVYTNASQEALKFVTWCLKKQPSNRMTTEDGLQHKWLSVLDVMIRRRETIKFSANRLRTFTRHYREKRRSQATDNNQLLTEYGQPPSR